MGGVGSGQELLKLRNAARNPGFYRAHWEAKDLGDVFVRIIFQIKEGNRGLIDLVHLAESLDDLSRVQLRQASWGNRRQFSIDLAQLVMGEAVLSPPTLKELAVQCRKKPAFHFR